MLQLKRRVRKRKVEPCRVLVQNVQAVQPLRSVQTVSRSSLPPPTRGKMKKGVERFELLERLEPPSKVNPSTSLRKGCTSRYAIDRNCRIRVHSAAVLVVALRPGAACVTASLVSSSSVALMRRVFRCMLSI
jgi:hypothetical protein